MRLVKLCLRSVKQHAYLTAFLVNDVKSFNHFKGILDYSSCFFCTLFYNLDL